MARTIASSSSASASSSTSRPKRPARSAQRLNILDLPLETQHAIFCYCDTPELVSLSVVSKRLHELAAAHLYRSFSVFLMNPRPPTRNTPPAFPGSVTLTGGLDTLTTSDYDYARFLKHFTLDTRSTGEKATPSYLSLQYSVNGGRFLNTLLHLALRNAKSLESFKWNISVELDRRVFKTLHKLPYLSELHVRWHVGSSQYEGPRPLPLPPAASPGLFESPMPLPHHPHSQGPPPPPPAFGVGSAAPHFYTNGLQSHFQPVHASPPIIMPPIIKSTPTPRAPRRQPMVEDPPTLSGFKYLRRLAVLNIDCLDMIPEIKSCISNSESTLTHLSLSFSNLLAQEAREADADQDPETTELDDDYHGPQHSTSSRPPLAQKEWRIQETVLGRILGVEKNRHKRQSPSQGEHDGGSPDSGDQSGLETKKKKTPKEAFIAVLKEASEKLLAVRGTEGLAGHSDGLVNVIEEAVGNYFESDAAKQKLTEDVTSRTATDIFEQGPGLGDTGESSTDHKPHAELNNKSPADSINIELSDPEEDESLGSEPSDDSYATQVKTAFEVGGESDSDSRRLTGSQSPLAPPDKQAKRTTDDSEAKKKQLMSDYVKSTRGLGLASLSLHLIPVKASVLNNALDLHALQSLTLLNVGNQAPLWTLFYRENQVKPLALRNIFTDNVSPTFLKCVSQLEKLYELFMIERSPRYRPATFVPWTTVTIHGIRKQILKKHLTTLKRLMIRNDGTSNWDLDAKTIALLCTRGLGLKELSAGFHMRGVHILLQHFDGLRNLKALHISPFRNDDTCAWAMQETTKFFIDSLVRYPQHKLEWLGVGDRARLVRREPAKKAAKSKKDEAKKKQAADKKGKGKAVTVGGGDSGVEEVTLALSADSWGLAGEGESSGDEGGPGDSDSDSDADSECGYEDLLKLRSIRLGLDHVDGVRIFEKEVRAGEL